MYSCARWIGLRVWKPTTVFQPRSANAARDASGRQDVVARTPAGAREGRPRAPGPAMQRLPSAISAATPGCAVVGRAVDVARLALEVALEDLLDRQHAQQAPVGRLQRQLVALGGVDAGRERDRDAPGQSVGEAHLVHDPLPVVGALEAAQRAEAAHRQQLQVRRLAGAQRRRAGSPPARCDQRVALLAPRASRSTELAAVAGRSRSAAGAAQA